MLLICELNIFGINTHCHGKISFKRKKRNSIILVDSLHQTVLALGVNKSKKKTEKVINKAASRIAELVADQMKKELRKIKEVKENKPKAVKAKKGKSKKVKAPVLETA